MNTLLIFFAFPIAIIILSIILEKLLNCPLAVAATFFAIFLVITFAVFDATFLIVGFILGGKVGIGTIISMLAIGPFIQFCLPYGKNIVEFIINEKDDSDNDSNLTVELN